MIIASVVLLVGVIVVSVIAGGPVSIGGSEPTTTTVAEPVSEPTESETAEKPSGDLATDRPEGHGHAEEDDEAHLNLPEAPGKATAAGEPEQVAREFADAWINRPSDGAELRRQNKRLVALSRGPWADSIGAMLKAEEGSGSRGEVVGVQALDESSTSVSALVTTREQLAPEGEALEPYHYGLYLVRLEQAGGGFAVSSWEPQF